MTLTIIPDDKPETKEPTLKEELNSVRGKVETQILEILRAKEHDPQKLAKTVANDLIKKMKADATTVLLKMIGFNNHWSSGWEIDHCNGRSGNSEIGDLAKKEFREMAINFIQTYKDEITILTKTQHKELMKNLQQEFLNGLKRGAVEQLQNVGKQYGKDMVDQILQGIEPHSVLSAAGQLMDTLGDNK